MTALAAAQKKAASSPDDANLKAAVATAQTAVTEATTKETAAKEAVAAAQKELDAATAAEKAAADAKAAADLKASETEERSQLAAKLKAETDKRATDTANAAKPKKVNVPVFTNPITLQVTPAPITLAVTNPPTPLKQGEKFELPVNISRLYAYKGNVSVAAVLPSGVSGVAIPDVQIPGNQTAGKLAFTAAANATPGSHEVIVRATLNLNGQNLTVDQPVTLNVQEVQQTAQK